MNQFDYNLVYETARVFAKRYSEEIEVQDKTQESVFFNGIEYLMLQLEQFFDRYDFFRLEKCAACMKVRMQKCKMTCFFVIKNV